ncbi:MAG TPA: agmatinase [Candidatus Polarisedimenticolaceae bacterium]|nr:agmatinase [Candidatus Polarisedimenticolaceae bacterium]
MHDTDAELPPFGGAEAASSFDAARAAVLPVPFEASVSYGGGTARGPEAILRASTQVELWDDLLGFEPYRHGIWTDAMLPVAGLAGEEAVGAVARRLGTLLDAGKFVMMLGGEHAITPGGVAATAERHPGLTVIQLDAHADLRQEYQGDRHSHACAMARALEHAPVRALGIRNYSVDEAAWMRRGIPGYRIVHGWEMDEASCLSLLEGLDGTPVYLTVDVDYFDPGIVPATGTPEPGGGAWWPTLRFLETLFRRTRVVAADVVELAPVPGLHHADFTVARLVHHLIGLKVRV